MIALLVMTLVTVAAQIGGPDLEGAQRAFREGRYAEALVRYESALSDPSTPRGAVLFNMGNCSYRLGRHAEAVLLFRRAELRLPGDDEVIFNRRLAERQLGLDAGGQASASGSGSGPLLLLLVTILQGAGLAGLVLVRKRRGLRLAAAVAVVVGVAGAVSVVRSGWASTPRLGVVLAEDVAVRREPHADLPPVVELRAGATVRVEEMSDRWVRISHPRGVGWTERVGVRIVD